MGQKRYVNSMQDLKRPHVFRCLNRMIVFLLFIFCSIRWVKAKIAVRSVAGESKLNGVEVVHGSPGSYFLYEFVISFGMKQRNQGITSLVFGMIFVE